MQSSRLRPKPRPPGTCSDPAAQRVSCWSSRAEPHASHKTPIYNYFPCLNPGQHVHNYSPSFRPGLYVKMSLSSTPSFSQPFRYGPTRRGEPSPCDTAQENLCESADPVLSPAENAFDAYDVLMVQTCKCILRCQLM